MLGLVERAPHRPEPVLFRSYRTSDFSSFGEILDAFTKDVGTPFGVDAAVAGVAGPVVGDAAPLTHVEWSISAAEIAAQFDTPHARLLNDLEAMAIGASGLRQEEAVELQRGDARDDGNAAEAGNFALRVVATSGVFVGGGIAPQILPALQDGRFIKAFCAKGPLSGLAASIPVHVMLMPEAGLLGAAVFAQELTELILRSLERRQPLAPIRCNLC